MNNSTSGTATAILWVHSNAVTGKPYQICVLEWYGRVDVMDQLCDDSKIEYLDFTNIRFDDWIAVRVEYTWEDTDYSIQLFQTEHLTT